MGLKGKVQDGAGGGGVFSKYTNVANRLENLRIVKVCILTPPPREGYFEDDVDKTVQEKLGFCLSSAVTYYTAAFLFK